MFHKIASVVELCIQENEICAINSHFFFSNFQVSMTLILDITAGAGAAAVSEGTR